MNEDMLRVGVITSTHGIKGEVKVFPTTDDPARFKKLKECVIAGKRGNVNVTVLDLSVCDHVDGLRQDLPLCLFHDA